jgi:hypothetical protein
MRSVIAGSEWPSCFPPLEAQGLAAAHPRGQQRVEHRIDARLLLACQLQDGRDLLVGPGIDLAHLAGGAPLQAPYDLAQVRGDVAFQKALLLRDVDDAAQHPEHIAHELRRLSGRDLLRREGEEVAPRDLAQAKRRLRSGLMSATKKPRVTSAANRFFQ